MSDKFVAKPFTNKFGQGEFEEDVMEVLNETATEWSRS
jgi:hypothetical protein